MAQRIWTGAELDVMTPAERAEVFEGSIIYELAAAPAEVVELARARMLERIAHEESTGR